MMKSWSNGSFGDLTQPSMPQGMRGEEWMGSPERFCSPREGALRGGVPLVGEELDLKGGKLVDLLARCETAGVCCLERRQGANGHPTLLFVHNITTRKEGKARKACRSGRMAKLSG
jgi:hypothetical protein